MLHWPEGPGGPSPRAVTGSRTLVSAVAGQRTSVVLQPRTRPPDRTENLPGFNRALFPLSLTGVPRRAWTCGDSNPGPPPCRGGALPTALQAHPSGARESNSVCPAPKAGGSASSLAPNAPADGDRPGATTDGRLHAIHCGLVKERRTQGWQDSNLQHPVLETGALAVELHPLDSNEKRRLPRTGRAASARVDARRYPPRMLQRTLEQPMSRALTGMAISPPGMTRCGFEDCQNVTVGLLGWLVRTS